MDHDVYKFCMMEVCYCHFHSYEGEKEVCCVPSTAPPWTEPRPHVPYVSYLKMCPRGTTRATHKNLFKVKGRTG